MPFYLDVLGVECSYGAVKVIDGMAFSIKQGCFAGIIGPNGSGKSDAFEVYQPRPEAVRGTVLLEGESLYKMSPGSGQENGRGTPGNSRQFPLYGGRNNYDGPLPPPGAL